MKKNFILLVILFISLSGCSSKASNTNNTPKAANANSTPKATKYTKQTSSKKPDFRKSNWGDSMEKVKATEDKENVSPDKKAYIFETTIADIPCYASFQFINNKLVKGGYLFTQIYGNKNNYIDDYKRIVKLLTRVYGSPKEDRENWKKGGVFTKDDPNDYGFSVIEGCLSYLASWENDKTEVKTCLKAGDNFGEIIHAIQYTEKNAQSLLEERETEGL